jgi:hypothetical protein
MSIEQPSGRGVRLTANPYRAGSQRSVARLQQLQFDPIGELVAKYRGLEKELERQELIREGKLVEMTTTGKARAYRADLHHAIYDKLIAVADKLLRYGYGRMPETINIEERRPTPLIVNLSKDNEQYVINNNIQYLEMNEDLADGDQST